MREGSGSESIPMTNSSDPDTEAQKNTDPTDPDHCTEGIRPANGTPDQKITHQLNILRIVIKSLN
jgi:hypothetical protein